jgi:hypothetical protein
MESLAVYDEEDVTLVLFARSMSPGVTGSTIQCSGSENMSAVIALMSQCHEQHLLRDSSPP